MIGKSAVYEGKEKYIHTIFTDIAPVYEKVNHALSFNLDRFWRKRSVEKFYRPSHKEILDACCGTGELTEILLQKLDTAGTIIGIDFCEDMLQLACQRHQDVGYVQYETGNIQALRFGDGSFDAVYNCFALRNLKDIPGALREMKRVIKPGGQLIIIDLTLPDWPIWRWYLTTVVPFIGQLYHGDHGPYSYLAASIKNFCRPAQLRDRIVQAGFHQVEYIRFLGGVVTAVSGTVKCG